MFTKLREYTRTVSGVQRLLTTIHEVHQIYPTYHGDNAHIQLSQQSLFGRRIDNGKLCDALSVIDSLRRRRWRFGPFLIWGVLPRTFYVTAHGDGGGCEG
jgi:hypothetical protein